MTTEQLDALRQMSDAKLVSHAQRLVQMQIPLAYAQGNTHARWSD